MKIRGDRSADATTNARLAENKGGENGKRCALHAACIGVAQSFCDRLIAGNKAPQKKKPGPRTGLSNSGGGSRIRTYDLLIKSQLLYQLSYTPDFAFLVGRAGLEPATNGLKVCRFSPSTYRGLIVQTLRTPCPAPCVRFRSNVWALIWSHLPGRFAGSPTHQQGRECPPHPNAHSPLLLSGFCAASIAGPTPHCPSSRLLLVLQLCA
jgi:hypothetical protein